MKRGGNAVSMFGRQNIKRIGFSLIRVHRYQSSRMNTSTYQLLLNQLKWPIEYMFVGARPVQNITAGYADQWRDWHRLTAMTNNTIDQTSRMTADFPIVPASAINAANNLMTIGSQVTSERFTVPTSTETIDTIQIQAHGINIFNTYKSIFFRDYLPYTFGGINIQAQNDQGSLMINFSLYPGT